MLRCVWGCFFMLGCCLSAGRERGSTDTRGKGLHTQLPRQRGGPRGNHAHALCCYHMYSRATRTRHAHTHVSRAMARPPGHQDTSLEPRPGTPLPLVRDEAGNPVPRALLLQRERREAARCLLYCCVRDQRLAPALMGELLELLAGLLSRLGGTGGEEGPPGVHVVVVGGGRGRSARQGCRV